MLELSVRDDTGDYAPEHAEIVKALLEHGANPNVRDEDGWTPLIKASTFMKESTVELLLTHGADPTAQDDDGDTALHYAAMADDAREVRALLRAGADPRVRGSHGESPLSIAQGDGNGGYGHRPEVLAIIRRSLR